MEQQNKSVVSDSIKLMVKYSTDARWDIVAKSIKIIEDEIIKKKFLSSLDAGNKGQKFFTSILDHHGFTYELCNTIEYDIKTLQPSCLTFEAKYDMYAKRSGNIAIEVWNTKKNTPSGLMATKADFWVHVLDENEIWVCKTSALRTIIDRNVPFRQVDGGDDNSRMLLYNKEKILIPPFYQITKDNFHEVLGLL